jgi:hypothetical protein
VSVSGSAMGPLWFGNSKKKALACLYFVICMDVTYVAWRLLFLSTTFAFRKSSKKFPAQNNELSQLSYQGTLGMQLPVKKNKHYICSQN